MYEKKEVNFKSPDLKELQEVIINFKTRIYIASGDDPEEAKKRYFAHRATKKP